MPELLPTRQATDLVMGIRDYLTTTFALSDSSAQAAIDRFLTDPENGMFKGPFVRLRLPFEPARDGWRECLEHYAGSFTPYSHQAQAFQRLSSLGPGTEAYQRPEPTLVTTGTGSGKTEAFLYPILDHVLRAQRQGQQGIKALILYPMNALANDQAGRLASLITSQPELGGVRAALYTGQQSHEKRGHVTAAGLITDRTVMRQDPPDILLTNYKMLDQLLLRHEDARLWTASATSLQYLVLDEFHTYDGAQGTDVAMLLRRLGLALKSAWPEDLTDLAPRITEADRQRPLGIVTPVATSATLGGSGGAGAMLDFAREIFGVEFGEDALITESRMDADAWRRLSPTPDCAPRLVADLTQRIDETNTVVAEDDARPETLFGAVLDSLFTAVPARDPESLLAALRHHPLTERLVAETSAAVGIRDLARAVLGPDLTGTALDDAAEYLSHVLALYSHVRAEAGREALTVETHLWIRELSRIDAKVDIEHQLRWGDDPPAEPTEDEAETFTAYLPAVYCRHCGRNGWGAKLAPTQTDLTMDPAEIRKASATDDASFRTLLYAANEAEDSFREHRTGAETKDSGLRYFHLQNRTLGVEPPEQNDPDYRRGMIIPVKCLTGLEAGELSRKDVCPACEAEDAIRFMGSAIATLTSVAVSNLFGDPDLDAVEKKALVFTDSVQDAAHRTGFIQARSHTFTLRTALRRAFGDHPDEGSQEVLNLHELVERAMAIPDGPDAPFERYRLVPPDLSERDGFAEYWQDDAAPRARSSARNRVRRRLLFDAGLELGLNARLGRTLELTGSVVVEADAGPRAKVLAAAEQAWASATNMLPDVALPTAEQYLHWVRGVLVRMRLQGGILHDWLRKYVEKDGKRYWLWGGRPRGQGMPAFPKGRPAPAFPVVGSTDPKDGLDPVTPRSSWYAQWTSRTLGVAPDDAPALIRRLFQVLADHGTVTALSTDRAATAYALTPEQVLVSVPTAGGLAAGTYALACSVCTTQTYGTPSVADQLDGAPCLQTSCPGELGRVEITDGNYYRELYSSSQARRVVAREHSSLLDEEVRLDYEESFKRTHQHPDDPNVLVATPTLEMGIDIGDLSCVILASLPPTVANYVQRVGRAGRLTGNSLVLAFARGRGQHLPKLYDPLSVINGEVRPPATYLEAEEILTRQFTAYLGDLLARDEKAVHPRRVAKVMGSTVEGTYLDQMLGLVRDGGGAVVDAFLDQFSGQVSDDGRARLHRWAADDLGPALERASHEWNQSLEDLRHRIRDVDDAVTALDAEYQQRLHDYGDAEHEKVREAERDVKSARAQLRRLNAELMDANGDWWISALERYGVFPNYTLIGDPVMLDVGISWRNEDTQQFEAETRTLERTAAVAIHELAPGATFYAYGMEIAIDAVDLGPELREVQYWQICPGCGWIHPVERAGGETAGYLGLAADCPRCRATGINDQGQVFSAVELTKVSAEIRRDESTITDSRDERQRHQFTVVPVADVEPGGVESSWSVESTGLGVEYLRHTTVTGLNLGSAGRRGGARVLAGGTYYPPLFTLCTYCGQQDTNRRANAKDEHRFWCRHRASDEEHTVDLLLAHRLRTQGVKLHLPASPAFSDVFTYPTLTAAVQLGLARHLGGTHGQVAAFTIPEPEDQHGRQALLIHDTVPGGTGYLAAFKDPVTVFGILKAAWDVVRSCSCQEEDRRACHQCLLPYAARGAEDYVSRVVAERLLGELLGVGEQADGAEGTEAPDEGSAEPTLATWTVQQGQAGPASAESALETDFRRALKERLKTVGAHITERPGARGEEVQFQLPNQRFVWRLQPQVDLDGTRPDFLLRPGIGQLPEIPIYTDGYTYHATPAYNRAGDDAVKRQRLRGRGYVPWAITATDVERFRAGPDAATELDGWITPPILASLQQRHAMKPAILRALGGGSMELLWAWINEPDLVAWRKVADLGAGLAPGPLQKHPLGEDDAKRFGVEVGSLATHLKMTPETPWWVRAEGAVQMLAAGEITRAGVAVRNVLVLDDSPAAVGTAEFRQAWSRWLLWSNVTGFQTSVHGAINATTGTVEQILGEVYGEAAVVAAPAPVTPVETPVKAETGVSAHNPVWDEIFEDADEDELEFLRRLAADPAVPTPEFGEELEGITPQLYWPEQRIAVVYELDEESTALEKAGWTVLGNDDHTAVLGALSGATSESGGQ
ncbi:DEAD/DEAH box helicase [Micrococcus sp. IITD107]|uniref:DEAD/DEAH box helicase n=1 Tax=Micrococcus sp. IITD107 TaxID=3342790 RepID=UPI0035B82431